MIRWWCFYWPRYALLPVRVTYLVEQPTLVAKIRGDGWNVWGVLHIFGVRVAVWTVR